MAAETVCPSEDDLLAFVEGMLDAGAAATMRAHLDACGACTALVAESARQMTGGQAAPESTAAEPDAAPVLEEGARVGRYQILGLLGRGAMGLVYLARDPELDRKVAIKLLRPESRLGLHGAEMQQRLQREAQAMARLRHPHILAIYDVGSFGDGVFLAIEFVEGRTLRRWLEEKPRTWREILAVFIRCGEGLAAAHRAGIVHRDFKPENVLIDGTGTPFVTDFGVAHVGGNGVPPSAGGSAPGGDLSLTRTGWLAGTPAYMAPEALLGRHVDARADVFSFCVALYEALHRQRPFAGNDLETLRRAVIEGRVRDSPEGAGTPARVRRAILRGLRPDPAQRFQTMEALLRELDTSAARRARRLALAAAGLAAVLLSAFGAREWWRSTLPASGRTLWLEVAPAQKPDEEWLGTALRRLAARKLGEADRRYQLAAVEGDANVSARVRWRLEKDGIVLDADLGRAVAGGARPLPAVRAPSAAEALDLLVAAIGKRLDEGQSERTPDAREASEMAELGTRSLAAFQLYQRALSIYFAATYSDNERAARLASEAIAADPGWGHAYALLNVAQGTTSGPARATLERGLGAADGARDPAGHALLEAVRILVEGSSSHASVQLKDLVEARPGDLLLRNRYAEMAGYFQRVDESIGQYGELLRRRPDLQFGASLALVLKVARRPDEAARRIAEWAGAEPESEQALLSLAELEVAQGRSADAERDIQRVLRIHGDAPFRLAPVCSMLLSLGKVAEAHRLAERMLRGNDLERSRGWLLLGVAAILEGRFTTAYEELQQGLPLARAQGVEGYAIQILESLRALAPLVGGEGDLERFVDEEAQVFASLGAPNFEALERYERALLDRPGRTCPDPEAALAPFSQAERTEMRPLLLRAAAPDCARCSEVVRLGLTRERSTRLVYLFAACAEAEGADAMAREAYQRAARMEFQGELYYSPYHSLLARFRDARLAEKTHDLEGARAGYRELLRYWGDADHPIPEVDQARAGLSRLSQ